MTNDALREAAADAFAEATGYRKPTDRKLIRHGINAAIDAYLAAGGDARQAERERCARVADHYQAIETTCEKRASQECAKAACSWAATVAASIAAAIRAGEEP